MAPAALLAAGEEVHSRLRQAGAKGRTLTLKIMRKKQVRLPPQLPAHAYLQCNPPPLVWPMQAALALLPGPAVQGAVEPRKFMGHGECDNLSRSGGCQRCCSRSL
jgi:hypothetical protein